MVKILSKLQQVKWLHFISTSLLVIFLLSGTSSYGQDADELAIDKLTAEQVVIDYVVKNKKLPSYYITKPQAREKGWNNRKGNLCQVLPGKAIGGDHFLNLEGGLPDNQSRVWYEADLNYHCGRRGSDRLLYSNDGLIYITHDHYQTFQQVETQ